MFEQQQQQQRFLKMKQNSYRCGFGKKRKENRPGKLLANIYIDTYQLHIACYAVPCM